MAKRAALPLGKSGGVYGRGVMVGPFRDESGGSRDREKLRREGVRRPYRKPTQVVR